MIRREPLRFMPPDDVKGAVEPDSVSFPPRPATPEDGQQVATPEDGLRVATRGTPETTHAVRGEGGR